ncbi:hypothetical protein BC938DRAFT_471697, partial [Jimgerdemannia flammicorona]
PDEVSSTEVSSTEVPSAEAPSAKVPSAKVPSAEAPSAEVPSAKVPSAKVPSAKWCTGDQQREVRLQRERTCDSTDQGQGHPPTGLTGGSGASAARRRGALVTRSLGGTEPQWRWQHGTGAHAPETGRERSATRENERATAQIKGQGHPRTGLIGGSRASVAQSLGSAEPAPACWRPAVRGPQERGGRSEGNEAVGSGEA